jgi:hypothetical protein
MILRAKSQSWLAKPILSDGVITNTDCQSQPPCFAPKRKPVGRLEAVAVAVKNGGVWSGLVWSEASAGAGGRASERREGREKRAEQQTHEVLFKVREGRRKVRKASERGGGADMGGGVV